MSYSTRRFTLNNKNFIGECSKLGKQPFVNIGPNIGIKLIDPKTGIQSEWIVEIVNTHKNDILAWILKPTTKTIQENWCFHDHTVTILND